MVIQEYSLNSMEATPDINAKNYHADTINCNPTEAPIIDFSHVGPATASKKKARTINQKVNNEYLSNQCESADTYLETKIEEGEKSNRGYRSRRGIPGVTKGLESFC